MKDFIVNKPGNLRILKVHLNAGRLVGKNRTINNILMMIKKILNIKKQYFVIVLVITLLTSVSCKNSPKEFYTIQSDALKDKIAGGWAGKTIGVTYGGPTEFRFLGTMVQDYQPIPWNDHYVKWWYDNSPGLYDDLYMNLSFVEVYDKFGLDASVDSFATAFAYAKYPLWHANQAARYNILNGIKPPLSGNWLNNPHADDIDFQIEADFAGLMSPGMPNSSSEICDKIGHIMNSGDGWYGGVYVAAMYTQAFFSNDVEFIVTEGLKAIPEKTTFYNCISDVIAWHRKYPDDWKKTWFEIEKKWTEDVGCPEGVFKPFNIDAKVNCAYVVMGLLYGHGDFNLTIDIATRGGQDSDCNPSTAGGILGTMLGYKKIPEFWKKSLEEVNNVAFAFTDISINNATNMGFGHAIKMIERNGGKVTGNEITIKTQKIAPVKYEQSFEGHYPVETKLIESNFKDTISIDFEGIGIVVTGNVVPSDRNSADRNYIAKAEIYLDNEMVESISMPLDNTIRKNDIFWKYKLPLKKHTLRIKWLNPDKNVTLRVNEALIYSDKPAISTIKQAEGNK